MNRIIFREHSVDINHAIDISFPVFETRRISCFGIEHPTRRNLYSITTSNTSGCECELLSFSPHAHGTHIESYSHVSRLSKPTLTRLGSLPPLLLTKVVPLADLSKVVTQEYPKIDALVLHSGWLHNIVREEQPGSDIDLDLYNPPYIDHHIMAKICTAFPNLQVLGIDSVSVDPAADDGALRSHREYFQRSDCDSRFIIELLCIPNNFECGTYAMCVNAAAIASDAIPCRPVVYPCTAIFTSSILDEAHPKALC